jgi:FixJ family two-component response regulator
MPDKAVFVVDDDAAVRQGLRFMLRGRVFCGSVSVDALLSRRSRPRDKAAPFLDVRMPQMTGLELQQSPRLAVSR